MNENSYKKREDWKMIGGLCLKMDRMRLIRLDFESAHKSQKYSTIFYTVRCGLRLVFRAV